MRMMKGSWLALMAVAVVLHGTGALAQDAIFSDGFESGDLSA